MGPRPSTSPSSGTLPPPPPTGYCPLEGFCRDFDAIDVIDNSVYSFKGVSIVYYNALFATSADK